ncbi:MAG: glyoxylate/hydroxypyruvate reductase A [Comamonas sp.]
MPTLAVAGAYLHNKTAVEELLRQRLPDWSIVRPDDVAASNACVAVCWDHPPGTWQQLPGVRMVHSIGAGVDALVRDPGLPDVPICRVIDQAQAQRLTEYVLWGTLTYHRGFDIAARNQREPLWQRPANRAAAEVVVGVMGLGEIGAHMARALAANNYRVRGWSRSPRTMDGVQTFSGAQGLGAFLDGVEVLICVLPLTHETEGILSKDLFSRLTPGAKLIHVGRGPQFVEADVLDALESGQLGGVLVDVFPVEPLPADNALWRHPKVIVTPHMAAVMPMPDVVSQIAENCERLLSGQPLLRTVERAIGY